MNGRKRPRAKPGCRNSIWETPTEVVYAFDLPRVPQELSNFALAFPLTQRSTGSSTRQMVAAVIGGRNGTAEGGFIPPIVTLRMDRDPIAGVGNQIHSRARAAASTKTATMSIIAITAQKSQA